MRTAVSQSLASLVCFAALAQHILAFTPTTKSSFVTHSNDKSTTTTTLSATKQNRIRSTLSRVSDSLRSKERSREDLKIGIAGFYDRSSQLWEEVWGEHMHHGYYIPADRTDHVQAQVDLIDEVLKWAGVPDPAEPNYPNTDTSDIGTTATTVTTTTTVTTATTTATATPTKAVDVGCGIGGSSRHIAKKYGCTANGITLSPYQANRGNELAKEQSIDHLASFQVADALDMPFQTNTFDLVWSLESGEHMPDKQQFVNELLRVATPGGRIIIVTWCHRDLETHEDGLTPKEQKLLAKINRAYYLPKWCSVHDYVQLLEKQGVTDVKREDWSYIIAPFWKAVIKSSLNLKSVLGLLRSGFSTQRGAYAMLLMLRGFDKGLIKFGLITCTKPQEEE